jgi:hypothetical protein
MFRKTINVIPIPWFSMSKLMSIFRLRIKWQTNDTIDTVEKCRLTLTLEKERFAKCSLKNKYLTLKY